MFNTFQLFHKAEDGCANLVQFLLQYPALAHIQVDCCLPQPVTDLNHDAHGGLVSRKRPLEDKDIHSKQQIRNQLCK